MKSVIKIWQAMAVWSARLSMFGLLNFFANDPVFYYYGDFLLLVHPQAAGDIGIIPESLLLFCCLGGLVDVFLRLIIVVISRLVSSLILPIASDHN